jgi:hypothetical protein
MAVLDADRGEVAIRELARSDRAAVGFVFRHLGAESRYQRFLAEHACRAGIRRFTATALASNRGAIAVARRLDGSLAVARHGHVVELSGSLAATTRAQRGCQGLPPRVATISSSARCSSSLMAFPPTPRKPPSL